VDQSGWLYPLGVYENKGTHKSEILMKNWELLEFTCWNAAPSCKSSVSHPTYACMYLWVCFAGFWQQTALKICSFNYRRSAFSVWQHTNS